MAAHFRVLHETAVLGARRGTLSLAGRSIPTPHYLALTSRGAVPHISHDNLREHCAVKGVYLGLEDFLDRPRNQLPAIYHVPRKPDESGLRRFTSLQDDTLLVLGPRRVPPVPDPPANTDNAISVLTSAGYTRLEAREYLDAVFGTLRPDIVVGMADLMPGSTKPGVKRREKMVDRTHAYTRDATRRMAEQEADARPQTKFFAPILPFDNTQQRLYLDDLADELREGIAGLAFYDYSTTVAAVESSALPDALRQLPRLSLGEPRSPHEVLRDVRLGVDLLTIPFIGAMTDGGIALTFTFPDGSREQERDERKQPLGIDLWSKDYETDTEPLMPACACYSCRMHHRAYIHHLLSAKEMLAWTLLQIHNMHVLDRFFERIRAAIDAGELEAGVERFAQWYEEGLPVPTGKGPRLRGYQHHTSGPGEPRQNPRAFGKLDDAAQKFAEAQSSVATPDTGAEGLEQHGFAERQSSP
ncbi:hypothetical protein VTN31DRAFT_5043 [Thermomyces dupontii]|uniref:uncharacterized protein n=1 Tax=Talaromyces thermophilus TaxID=28565 RepID=UPI003741E8B1